MAVFPAGHILTSADFDTLFPTGVGAWESYTPTLVQSVAVAKTTSPAGYMKVGRKVTVEFRLLVTGTGTASNEIRVGLPFPAAGINTLVPVGTAYVFDSSTGLMYKAFCQLNAADYITFTPTTTTNNDRLGVAVFTAALANGDQVGGGFTYQATS